jgi:hypothetical protein
MLYPSNSKDIEFVPDDEFLYKTKWNKCNNTSGDVKVEIFASSKFCSESSIMISKPVPPYNLTKRDILNRIEITYKMRPLLEFIIPMFLNCSTCFERHTSHRQELKNCNCSRLWFYIRLWLQLQFFELLMMSGASLETCWAIKKHWNNKF